MEPSTEMVSPQPVGATGCIQCRMISGMGLITASAYVAYHAKMAKQPYSKAIAGIFAAALGGVGVARLFGLPPFHLAGVINANEDSAS